MPIVEILFFLCIATALVPPFGLYMKKIFNGESTFISPLLAPLERWSYRLAKINPQTQMGWKKYLKSLFLFNLVGFFVLFLILLLQGYLPLNPQGFKGLPWDLALNTAMSFVTNTNWQAYSGETALSYGTQMWGLCVQNFLSPATGAAALLVLIRGITQENKGTIGNFWVDLVRTVIYLLLPLAFIFSLFLISQGVVQTFSPYVTAHTLESASQTIPLGPAASQIAIKQLGTNGGGFFAANSAHPFENPTPYSNFFELLAITLIPAAAVSMYGREVGSKKHGWLLLAAMFLFWLASCAVAIYGQFSFNPLFGVSPPLEGVDNRIGPVQSILWSIQTTATANGSVNCMLDSLAPLAGGAALFNMMLGELVFGGVGVGLCSMLMFVLLTLFLSGLMVGRTPEYQGKKIEKKEMQWVIVAVLAPAACILIGGGMASLLPEALAERGNKGPHGLTEILYAFVSAASNNGSAFNGLQANTVFFNVSLTVVMFLGRLAILLPSIALGGLFAQKKVSPACAGTFSTETLLFFCLLIGVILIVGILTFFPALCLGPIIEHFLMLKGVSFR